MGRGFSKISGGGGGGSTQQAAASGNVLTAEERTDFARQLADNTISTATPPVFTTQDGTRLSDSERDAVIQEAAGMVWAEIAPKFSQKSVPIYDKWGEQFDTHTGYVSKSGNRLINVEKHGSTYSVRMGDTTRGFVAANNGLDILEAWKRARNYLNQ